MKKETKISSRSKKLDEKIHSQEKMYYVFGFETDYIEMETQEKRPVISKKYFFRIKKCFIDKLMPLVNFFRYL
jgi:hypothetical protein